MTKRRKKIEAVANFIFLGSKITADDDCSHEIKRRLLLGRNVMANLDSILKRRDITLPTKVPQIKAMVFPVVLYGCEIWTVKKAEHQRIDAFELWCWRRLLTIPWTVWRSNQSILKEISPGCSLEELMWKLKLPFLVMNISSFFDVKSWLIQNTLMLGKIEGRSRRGQQRRRQFGPEFGWILGVGDGQGGLAWCRPWGCKELYMTDQLNWTEEVWKRKGKCCVFTYLWTLVNKTNEQMQWNRLKSTMNSGWEGLRRYVK